jgi:hypothetical protein
MNDEKITNRAHPIAAGTMVRVIKLRTCDAPVLEPGNWNDWNIGGCNPLSLPVDYEVRGLLLDPVQIGGRIRL